MVMPEKVVSIVQANFVSSKENINQGKASAGRRRGKYDIYTILEAYYFGFRDF